MKSSPILTQSAVAILCALCLLAQATAQAGVDLVISGLDQPVRLVAPAGDPRLFVVQRTRAVRGWPGALRCRPWRAASAAAL